MDSRLRQPQSLQDLSSPYSRSSSSRSPSIMSSMPWLRGLAFQKKIPATQTPPNPAPKRRGPKPDSKPAQTRRQELNRQAQRTHRERKEQYIRTLENELSRLRESYADLVNHSRLSIRQLTDAVNHTNNENLMLRDILASHNIDIDDALAHARSQRTLPLPPSSAPTGSPDNPPPGSSNGSAVGPDFSAYLPSSAPNAPAPSTLGLAGQSRLSASPHPGSADGSSLHPQSSGRDTTLTEPDVGPGGSPSPSVPKEGGLSHHPIGSDLLVPEIGSSHSAADIVRDLPPVSSDAFVKPGVFEKDPQLEIDFILTLEGPCRDHLELLNRRALDDDEEQEHFCGHSLMASCPPPSQAQFAATTAPGVPYPTCTYDLPYPDLTKLLNLSRQLVSNGQVTPIMALQSLKNHEAYYYLTPDDIHRIMDELVTKIRCYGFGAVVEDFEFADALHAIVAEKSEGGAASRFKAMFGHRMYDHGFIPLGSGPATTGMPQIDEFLFA